MSKFFEFIYFYLLTESLLYCSKLILFIFKIFLIQLNPTKLPLFKRREERRKKKGGLEAHKDQM